MKLKTMKWWLDRAKEARDAMTLLEQPEDDLHDEATLSYNEAVHECVDILDRLIAATKETT